MFAWPSITQLTYNVSFATNLTSGWTVLASNLTATIPMNSFTQAVDSALNGFYRISFNMDQLEEENRSFLIQFTAAEGYANGVLEGQPGSGTNWNEKTTGVFTVDTANGGQVQFSTASTSWKRAVLENISLGTTNGYMREIWTEFSFTRGTLLGNTSMFALALTKDTTARDGVIVSLNQKDSGPDQFQLNVTAYPDNNWESGGNSTTFSGSLLGIANDGASSTDDQSDRLKLLVKNSCTDGASSWRSEATLYNEDTATMVAEFTLNWVESDQIENWTTVDKTIQFSTQNIGALPGTAVTIHEAGATDPEDD